MINESYEQESSESELEISDLIGYTYILVRNNNPNLVKVGYTSQSAELRALNYTDGEWKVHKKFMMPLWLARLTEQATHKRLEMFWLDPKITGGTASEVFTCSFEVAEKAVEDAYQYQMDRVLTSLKLPKYVKDFVFQQNGLSDASKLGELVEQINLLKSELKNKEIEIKDLKNKLSVNIEKNKTLITRLENIQCHYPDELYSEIKELESFSDNHIKPSQFEKLREDFRKSIEIIRTLCMRESKQK